MGLLSRKASRVGSVPVIVVSNREPFVHERLPSGELTVSAPVGGLTSALQPLVESTGGTWVAWGSGAADFDVAPDGVLRVPPDRPAYRLRRLALSEEEVQSYYIESANRGLWPLCHSMLHRFSFNERHWRVYEQVNGRFAQAAIEEARDQPAVAWVQDYHLSLAPAVLRQSPNLFVHQFWHIPWPSADILRVLPSARRVLRGMLGNHLLVFQTERDKHNFLGCARRFFRDSRVDAGRSVITFEGRRTTVRAHPISIDVKEFVARSKRSEAVQHARALRRRLLPQRGQLLLGVDRIDYTKGIPRRFESYRQLLEQSPELRGQVAFLQIAVPSRTDVPEYSAFEQEVVALTESINRRFGTASWTPIHLVRENWDANALAAAYSTADVCIVTPLQDGMNLVAKEFVACKHGRLGVLLLSRFAGSAEDMDGAILVNPYDVSAVSGAMKQALTMDPSEREDRMGRMTRRLEAHTIYDWMQAILADVARLRRRE